MAAQKPYGLTRRLRWEAIREARRYVRENYGVESFEVADHVFTFLMSDTQDRFGTDPYPATDVSDYAYGIANFVCGGRGGW
jgi:hypothetical protein